MKRIKKEKKIKNEKKGKCKEMKKKTYEKRLKKNCTAILINIFGYIHIDFYRYQDSLFYQSNLYNYVLH